MPGIFIHPVVMSTRNVPGVGSTVVNQLPSHAPPPKGGLLPWGRGEETGI